MAKSIAFIFAIVVLLTSCAKEESKNVNQDSIYTIYELFYNTEKDVTTAQATFRFGGPTGTLLKLSDSATSTFNSDLLLYNLLGVHNKEYTGFINQGTFVYNDLDNNTFTNSTKAIDTIAFPAVDTINSANAFTFQWIGNPIDTNERVTLTINGTQQANFEIFTNLTFGDMEIILPANKLQNLGVGEATCALKRVHEVLDVDQGTSKGGRITTWYTTEKKIYIK